MNSSSDMPEDFSSPERIVPANKLTPRTLTYDDDDLSAMIRRRPCDSFSKSARSHHNNNNDTDDKSSVDDDDDAAALINRQKPLIRPSIVQASKIHLESPPYRKVRALRLFDTPATPKTIIYKSAADQPPNSSSKLIRKPILTNVSGFAPRTPNVHDRPKAFPVHNKALEPVTANINPFSPTSSKSRI